MNKIFTFQSSHLQPDLILNI